VTKNVIIKSIELIIHTHFRVQLIVKATVTEFALELEKTCNWTTVGFLETDFLVILPSERTIYENAD
jgi:hypothetical protein